MAVLYNAPLGRNQASKSKIGPNHPLLQYLISFLIFWKRNIKFKKIVNLQTFNNKFVIHNFLKSVKLKFSKKGFNIINI